MLRRSILWVICIVFTSCTLRAQWVPNVEKAKKLIVDTYTPYNIISLETSGNSAYIIWQDKKENNVPLLYFQTIDNTARVRFRADGRKLTNMPGAKDEPIAQVAPDGMAYVLWKDFTRSASGELYLQKLDVFGNMQFGEDGLLIARLNNPSTKYNLAVDAKNNAYITVIEKRDTVPSWYNVQLRKVSPTGSLVWGEDGVSVYKCSSPKYASMVTPDKNGGAYVSWLAEHAGKNIIMVKYVDKDGKTDAAKHPLQVSSSTENVLTFSVLPAASDKMMTVWQTSGKNKEICYQLITAKGNLQYPEPLKVASRMKGSKTAVQALALSDSTVFVSWLQDLQGTQNKRNLYVQKILATGKFAWGDSGRAVARAGVQLISYSAATNTQNEVFLAWLDRNEPQKQVNIVAQKISPQGYTQWGKSGYVILRSNEPDKSYLKMVNYSGKTLAAIYREKNKLETAIYGQRIFTEQKGISVFADVSASVKDDSVVVAWSMQNETLVKSYHIEKFLLKTARDTAWSLVASVPARPFHGNNDYRYAFMPDSDGVYFFRIVQMDGSGVLSVSENQKVSYIKDFGDKTVVLQNNPNPCSDSTAIYFYLPQQMPVKLEFYNSRIERVDEYYLSDARKGRNKFVFNARRLPEGIYFYRFTAGDVVEVKKMVVTR